jgi:hypothetical protein
MLGVTTSRVTGLVHGKLNLFVLDDLVRMAVAAGLTVSHEALKPFDAAEWLTSDEAIAIFLAEAEETGDVDLIAAAKEDAERAKAINRSKKSKGHGQANLRAGAVALAYYLAGSRGPR